jgi:hypothetical protein
MVEEAAQGEQSETGKRKSGHPDQSGCSMRKGKQAIDKSLKLNLEN